MPCTYLIGLCNNATLWASCCSRCFKCNSCKVSFDNGNYPLLILFVNNSNAQFTYLLSISYLNLDEIFSMSIGLIFEGNLSCFALLRSALPMILPSSHNFIHFPNALKCFLLLTFDLAFVEAMMVLYELYNVYHFCTIS